jgi:hypothetical protein
VRSGPHTCPRRSRSLGGRFGDDLRGNGLVNRILGGGGDGFDRAHVDRGLDRVQRVESFF